MKESNLSRAKICAILKDGAAEISIDDPCYEYAIVRNTHNKFRANKIIIKFLFFFLLLSQSAIGSFIVEVPFYCPPPNIAYMQELIKQEYRHFQAKVIKYPEK